MLKCEFRRFSRQCHNFVSFAPISVKFGIRTSLSRLHFQKILGRNIQNWQEICDISFGWALFWDTVYTEPYIIIDVGYVYIAARALQREKNRTTVKYARKILLDILCRILTPHLTFQKSHIQAYIPSLNHFTKQITGIEYTIVMCIRPYSQ